jgi:hypothetical protein
VLTVRGRRLRPREAIPHCDPEANAARSQRASMLSLAHFVWQLFMHCRYCFLKIAMSVPKDFLDM